MEQVKAADELKRRIALQEYQSRQQQSGPSRRTASSQDDSNAGRIQSMMNSSRPLQDSSMSDRTSSGGESFMLLGGDWVSLLSFIPFILFDVLVLVTYVGLPQYD